MHVAHRLGIRLGWGLLILAATGSMAAAPKRVLVVHSFLNAAPPFTTHSTAFETTLTAEMGERVDLDEVSLDVARYATWDIDEALVEYMSKRHEKWKPDLVVPIGSPAGIFVARCRDRLFPATPVIYTGMDRRRLPPDARQSTAAFVGESCAFGAMVEDMLRVAPDTTNIVVVLGASKLEQYWAAAIQREWQPFTNRVHFTWLNDLTFDQMLERVSHTPPHSFIFLVLLMRDASGVTHNADEALRRIHAVANAPVNGIFQHQLGMGIVGGRLYQAEQEGVMQALRAAGAQVLATSCGACAGYGSGIGEGVTVIATTARNFKGRMGPATAQVYLASPYTVAASALRGRVTDPRGVIG